VRVDGTARFYRTEFSGRALIRANFSGAADFNEAIFGESVTFSGWRNINAQMRAGLSFAVSGKLSASDDATRSAMQRLTQVTARAKEICATQVDQTWIFIKSALDSAKQHLEKMRRRFSTHDPNTELFTVFAGGGQMQNVIFRVPEHTLFTMVDLSRIHFSGTNLRGVRFLGTNWWQPKLGRNGLQDEIFIRMSTDGPFRFRYLPILEETCRNLRVALEENRDFNAASDFYIAELEAARARLPWARRTLFSIPALYRISSVYGTSVVRALVTLLMVTGVYVGATLAEMSQYQSNPIRTALSDALTRSARVLIFQTQDWSWSNTPGLQIAMDASFRVLGLAQLTMLVLAFRSRIKR
jgi:uncharacterized protein YjbI with pentapeptide repeats